MESNPRKKRKIETEIVRNAERTFWDIERYFNENIHKYVNIGTDRVPFCTNDYEMNDIVMNNFDKCKIKRLHGAMTLPCMCVFNMDRLVASDPRLKKICIDVQNNFFYSSYESYRFNNGKARSDKEIHEKANDFKYLINLGGSHLKILNVEEYPFSKIMPLINTNCPNLNELILQFKKIEDQDFENVFSNLSHLEVLRINFINHIFFTLMI